MGSSSSSSQLKQDYITNTSTTVGDIGLTGSQAADVIKAGYEAGNISTGQAIGSNTDITKTVINSNERNTALFSGNLRDAYGASLAFAKDIANSAFSSINSSENKAYSFAGETAAKAINSSNQVITAGADALQASAGNITGTVAKYGTYIAIAAIAFFILKGKR